MDVLYFNSNLIPEILDLPFSQKEKVIQGLHWAIAERLDDTSIKLAELRDGVELKISSYDYSELYNAFKRV